MLAKYWSVAPVLFGLLGVFVGCVILLGERCTVLKRFEPVRCFAAPCSCHIFATLLVTVIHSYQLAYELMLFMVAGTILTRCWPMQWEPIANLTRASAHGWSTATVNWTRHACTRSSCLRRTCCGCESCSGTAPRSSSACQMAPEPLRCVLRVLC